MNADLILFNGRITTLSAAAPESQALAIQDGHVVAVGSNEEIMRNAGPRSKRIDLHHRPIRSAHNLYYVKSSVWA
jgi:hypothetical protein